MSTGLSPKANDLCLCVLNTGAVYKQLCMARARLIRANGSIGPHVFNGVIQSTVVDYRKHLPGATFSPAVRDEVREYLYEQTLNFPEEYAHCLK